MARCNLALLLIHISFCVARPSGEGAGVIPTVGAPWPMPQKYVTTDSMYMIDPINFKFVATGQICDIIDAAFSRYQQIIFAESSTTLKFQPNNIIPAIAVTIVEKCDKYPSLDMDEACKYIICVYNFNIYVKYHDQLIRGMTNCHLILPV